ncbi:toll-like receptor Tollo [Patella vulgata]|uniref:toll-like receptor Tollo n=1 Tax=Patella vulgata TaxID=6465 RepID=UPI0024A8C906|nr:toll-like receptor Tollo [Patella vulgata]
MDVMDTLIYSLLFIPLFVSGSVVTACVQVPDCQCESLSVNSTDIKVTCHETSSLLLLPKSVSILEVNCFNKYLQQTPPADLFLLLSKLHSVKFIGCRFDGISTTLFQWPRLRNIRFTSCFLRNTSLIFNTSLVELEISDSGLTSFPEIRDLDHLEVLNISNNGLESYGMFEKNCEVANLSLKHIDFSGNAFKTFPNLSNCAPNLISLKICHGAPLKLETNLNDLGYLESLDLTGTILEGHIGNLRNLTKLNVLHLVGVGQMLEFFPRDHPKLKELHLQNVYPDDKLIWELGHLPDLTQLKLIKCNITSLPSSTFLNLTLLEDLDLSDNRISSVEPGLLDDLVNLRHLNLSHNAITHVYKGTFTPPGLTKLDISVNQIKFITQGSFDNLTDLIQLNLTSNKIASLPKNIFQHLISLENLFLKRNTLKALPSFSKCTKLTHLDLKDNLLNGLTSTSFEGLVSLVGISVRNNSLFFVSSMAFKDSPELSYIDLSHNQILSIQKHLLYSTPWGNLNKLNFLRLDYNNLTRLSSDLSYFTNLQKLFLDHNKIDRVYPDMFPESLVLLDLSSNRIRTLGQLMTKLKNLHKLNLQYNYRYLRKLSTYSFYLGSAHQPTVYIGFNEFICDCGMMWLKALTIPGIILPSTLQKLPYFPDIDRTFCENDGPSLIKLRDYPTSKFVCEYEKDDFECDVGCGCCLDSNYRLNGDCPCVYRCPKGCQCKKSVMIFQTNEIQCQNRNLSSIPLRLPLGSTEINLSGNDIPMVTRHFLEELDLLNTLYLNGSRVKWLSPGCFDGMPRLQALYLDHNLLTSIPSGLFQNLKSLEQLYLHNNLISFIVSDAFHGLNHGLSLSLHDNKLSDLGSLDSLNSNQITTVSLSNNPWSCRCDFITEFRDFLTINAERIKDIDDIACTWPASEENMLNYNDSVNITMPELYWNSTDRVMGVLDYNYSSLCSNKTVIVNTTIIQQVLQEDDRLLGPIIGLVFFFSSLAVLAVLIVWKRQFVQVVIYTKFGVRFVPGKENNDREYKYDAFVSHSSKDEEFILKELMPKLEQRKKLRLCLHFRDFPVGESIADNIIEAVDASRRTLLIISNNFLQSEWCKFEFQTAHHEVLTNHAENIVIVLLDDIDQDAVDPDLRTLLKTKTYVKYGDPWFWEKLYFALPDKDKIDDDNVAAKGEEVIRFERI